MGLRHSCEYRNFAAMPNPAAQLLSVGQVAEALALAPRTVLHRIQLGKIEATKVGSGRTSAYVITRAEVDRVKAEREATSA